MLNGTLRTFGDPGAGSTAPGLVGGAGWVIIVHTVLNHKVLQDKMALPRIWDPDNSNITHDLETTHLELKKTVAHEKSLMAGWN